MGIKSRETAWRRGMRESLFTNWSTIKILLWGWQNLFLLNFPYKRINDNNINKKIDQSSCLFIFLLSPNILAYIQLPRTLSCLVYTFVQWRSVQLHVITIILNWSVYGQKKWKLFSILKSAFKQNLLKFIICQLDNKHKQFCL